MSLGALALVGVAWLFVRYPQVVPPRELPPATSADVARGRYLFEHVLGCHDCHSERDWRYFAGPVNAGTAGGGALIADPLVPAFSANITPHALRDWSDGEIACAIAEGVSRSGQHLHPLMPSDTYRELGAGDLRGVVAYLRTLPPVAHDVPQWRVRSIPDLLVVKLIGRTLPRPYEPHEAPSRKDSVAYGRYLARTGECHSCHGSDLAGGRGIRIGNTGLRVTSQNLTRDMETGIGGWTRENFVSVFRSFQGATPVRARGKNTPMPWLRYASMTDADLEALYEYTRSLPPVRSPQLGETQR